LRVVNGAVLGVIFGIIAIAIYRALVTYAAARKPRAA
jgi:hypothetical protein